MSKMKLRIADLMKEHGDEFTIALSECVRLADSDQYMKLKEAFPMHFQTYHPSQWIGDKK